jgi:hypothetical protein
VSLTRRYVAAGADVGPKKNVDEAKLEEDIGAPFLPRFSHSGTTEGPIEAPGFLGQASAMFAVLGRLRRDDEPCSPKLRLLAVNQLRAYERVLKGPKFRFGKTEAEVALILWSDGPEGRPLVGEFSFRYGHENEKYSAEDAKTAMQFFLEVQRLDWIAPEGRTKTQYAYRA